MARTIEVQVPDIGGFKDVDVIDVLVSAGQQIERDAPLITLETEKATMDVPAPQAGRVVALRVNKGDKVSQGSVILVLEAAGETSTAGPAPVSPPVSTAPSGTSKPASAPPPAPPSAPVPVAAAVAAAAVPAVAALPGIDEARFSTAYASPSVRKFARELGADLSRITGTGPKQRITHDDVKAWVKRMLSAPQAPSGPSLPAVPVVDFAAFGPVEIKPLSRIQKISGARLQASWINLPHVTQHEDADITELEVARTALKTKATTEGVKLTPLAFIVRACVRALAEYPKFNTSLDPNGAGLVYKQYCNIGFAADTPNGLVVPVIRGADKLSLFDVARALAALSEKARAGKLLPTEMQGGTFTISSLGGIGGTAFTPIINAPEVAILGVSRSAMKPVFQGGSFVPRLMLPLSLSYDHRVIDGADAARFAVFLAQVLGEPKALM